MSDAHDLLRKAAKLFRTYENNHRSKVLGVDLANAVPEVQAAAKATITKANTNADIAWEIEKFLSQSEAATGQDPDQPLLINVSDDLTDTELNVFNLIRDWAKAKDLIGYERAHPQVTKLTEELGEVAGAVARNNPIKLADGIGDVIVVLTILAIQHNLLIEDRIETAWNEIKDRTGVTVNGVFIKDE